MNDVAASYDDKAELYAELFLHGLDDDKQSQVALAAFAERAAACGGPVVDLGCGPGGVVHHLNGLGLQVSGYDISPGQIEQAKLAFPDLTFQVGDLTTLDHADGSLGGIVSKYSVIHLPPSQLDDVFSEWKRALEPTAPLFLSFFGSLTAEAHGTPFGHTVATAYELFPTTVGQQLEDHGFADVQIETNPIPPGGRPFDHVTMLAHKRA